jgi:DNA-binding MarR family transcriptional regulator
MTEHTLTPQPRTLTPAPTEPAEIAAAVMALSAALTDIDGAHRRIRHRLARDLGFSTGELTAVHLIGSTEHCSPKHLALELDLSTGAITALVDRLEKAGHAERMVHPTDRRSQLLTLTFRGEEAMEIMMSRYNAAIEDVVKNSPCVFDAGLIECLRHAATAIDHAAILA